MTEGEVEREPQVRKLPKNDCNFFKSSVSTSIACGARASLQGGASLILESANLGAQKARDTSPTGTKVGRQAASPTRLCQPGLCSAWHLPAGRT